MRCLMVLCAAFSMVSFGFAGGKESGKSSGEIVQQPDAIKGKVFTGRPVFIDDVNNVIIIQDDRKRQAEFCLADTAKILRDGEPIIIRNIDAKSSCTVTYRKKKDRLIGLRIEQSTRPLTE